MEVSSNAEIRADAPAACGPDLPPDPSASTPAGPSQTHARLLAALLESASVPFAGLGPLGDVVCANRAFAALAAGGGEVTGRGFETLVNPADRAAVREALDRVGLTGAPATVACRFTRGAGDVAAEVAFEVDGGRDGGPPGFLAFAHDRTEGRRVEAALRESEERFRRLYDEAPVGYHEVDAEGTIVNINKTECELLGYAHAELIGRPVFEIVAEEFREAARRAFLDKIAGRRPLAPFERTIQTRDGRRLVIAIEERYRRDPAGKVVGLVSTLRDVTDRKRVEAALVSSERRARALFEGMEEAVFVHAPDGRILDANPAASRLLGYSHEEFLTLTTADVDDPEFAAGYAERLGRQVTDGRLACEGKHRTKDGRVIPVEIKTALIQLDDGPAVLAVIRDVSERQALERMRAVLTQSERLASIGLLSAGVAHEINNPLAYVGNNLAVLERDLSAVVDLVAIYEAARPALEHADPEAVARVDALSEDFDWPYVRENLPRMLARTRDGVRRVANIVASLRTLARTTPTKKEPAAIPELFESALEMLRGRLRRGQIEVVVEHGDVPKLSCVPTQISQVILNLLINATQAVELGPRHASGRIVFRSERAGDTVVLSVSDNGAGIDPEDVPRLFDPFFTTKGLGEGTGLGLSICHGIVTGHGGRIEVDGGPGLGATFRLVFPLDAP